MPTRLEEQRVIRAQFLLEGGGEAYSMNQGIYAERPGPAPYQEMEGRYVGRCIALFPNAFHAGPTGAGCLTA